MSEIKTFVYNEIRSLANKELTKARNKASRKHDSEYNKIKAKAKADIWKKIKGNVKLEIIDMYSSSFRISGIINKEEQKKLMSGFSKEVYKLDKEMVAEKDKLSDKYDKWLFDFAKNVNKGKIMDLPVF